MDHHGKTTTNNTRLDPIWSLKFVRIEKIVIHFMNVNTHLRSRSKNDPGYEDKVPDEQVPSFFAC